MKKILAPSFLLVALLAAGCGQTGIICTKSEVRCGNTCANLAVDPVHCGACGNTCATGFVCTNSTCQCPSNLTACGQSCVDLQTSLANCGACGTACAAGQVCGAGSCAGSCPTTSLTCNGGCVDPQSDAQNCGTCGHACAQGEACHAGTCEPDLYAACFNSGAVYALDARGETVSPNKAVGPPTLPVGLAFAGPNTLEVADLGASLLYGFDVTSGFGTPTSVAIGGGATTVTVSGTLAVVVNSSDSTVDLFDLTTSPGPTLRCPSATPGCTASAVFDPGSFPEYAAITADHVYVSLQGDTSKDPDPAGNKVGIIKLADLGVSTVAITGNLQPNAGGTSQARPQGVAVVGSKLFVALANLSGFTPGGPGLVAAFDIAADGSLTQSPADPIKLGDGCINAAGVLVSGTTLYVACGTQYDANFQPVVPGALAALNTTTLQPAFAPQLIGCAAGTTCQLGAPTRLALAGGKVYLADSINGRLFTADPATGAIERGANNPVDLCLAPDGGFDFVSDVAARP